MQDVIVSVIICIAVVYLFFKWFRKGNSGCGCGCSCGGTKKNSSADCENSCESSQGDFKKK